MYVKQLKRRVWNGDTPIVESFGQNGLDFLQQ